MFWKEAGFVALGGAAGAVARFAVSAALPRTAFPWPTLAVNLAGSFLLGFAVLERSLDDPHRLWFGVGFLGSFTTLSTYSAETLDLWRTGHTAWAGANLVANAVGGPVMALLGWKLAS